MPALVEASIILLFGVAPLVAGAYLNRLPSWKMRGLGIAGACLLVIPVYTVWLELSVDERGPNAFAWWLVGLSMVGPVWCIATGLGFLAGGFMRSSAG